MKKALIALAVLGAASGAAMAQSSVTLYGVADIAIGKSAATGETKWGAESNSPVTNGTSRIGFTGKEDLGGGLWAGFAIEGAVNLATGAASSGITNGPVWARQAWVGLGSTSFGTVHLGRDYTTGFDGQGVYELTGWANYSVLANTFGFGAYSDPRSNVQIKYQTPNFAGASAELSYVPKADGALVDNGTANRTDRWGLNVVYNQGPIKGAFTVDKSQNTATGGLGNKANYTLGGSYTFGNNNSGFVVSASYNRANNAYVWNAPNAPAGSVFGANYGAVGRRFGWELGGSALLGAFTLTADLTRDTKNDIYAGHKYTNGLLAGQYALSKRTFLYADYLRLDGTNNYGLGLRHNF